MLLWASITAMSSFLLATLWQQAFSSRPPYPYTYLRSHRLLLRTDDRDSSPAGELNSTRPFSDSSPMYMKRYFVDGRGLSLFYCSIKPICLLRSDPREPDDERLDVSATNERYSRSPLIRSNPLAFAC
jgi:hypothetical protein